MNNRIKGQTFGQYTKERKQNISQARKESNKINRISCLKCQKEFCSFYFYRHTNC